MTLSRRAEGYALTLPSWSLWPAGWRCSTTAIGVWSENSLDRTVVVAVYGQPGTPF